MGLLSGMAVPEGEGEAAHNAVESHEALILVLSDGLLPPPQAAIKQERVRQVNAHENDRMYCSAMYGLDIDMNNQLFIHLQQLSTL